MIELRDYQLKARDAVIAEWEHKKNPTLIVMATGCVSGETIINLNRASKGGKFKIKDVLKRQKMYWWRHPDIKTNIRSYISATGLIGLNEAVNFVYSGDKETYTLDLDNGFSLRATPDHKIMTERGWIELSSLSVGVDSVLCDTMTSTSKRVKKSYVMGHGLSFHPYCDHIIRKYSHGLTYRVPLHRLVAEADLNKVSLQYLIDCCRHGNIEGLYFLDPAVYAVHHVDGNHKNNDLSNLKILTHLEHVTLHGNNRNFGHPTFSKVKSINPFGIEPTYDVVCKDPDHNFVANGMVVHNCGKTEIALSVLSREKSTTPGFRALFIVNTLELVLQPVERVKLNWPEFRAGIVQAENNDVYAELIAATWQSLTPARLESIFLYGKITHVVCDECFPAGTLIDGRPIQSIQKGDYVTAWNNGAFQSKKVVNVLKRKAPDRLIKIVLSNGESIVCTPNHPILIDGDTFIPASNVKTGDCMVQKIKKREGINESKNQKTYRSSVSGNLQLLSKRISCNQENDTRCFYAHRSALLRARVRKSLCCAIGKGESEKFGGKSGLEPAHERSQSYGRSGDQRKNEDHVDRHGAQTEITGGKRETASCASAVTSLCLGVGNGISDCHKEETDRGLSQLLQAGYSQSRTADRGGSGRRISLFVKNKKPGQKEGRAFNLIRVENIEVLEQGSYGQFGEVCPDGFVYNLEVEDWHTYTANGYVVHNCHGSTANVLHGIIDTLKKHNPEIRIMGMTATPIRTDGDGLSKIFKSVAFRFPINLAIKAGALCPFSALGIGLPADLSVIEPDRPDQEYNDDSLGEILSAENILEIVLENWQKYAADRRTLGFTATVAQARKTAEYFQEHGVKAAYVHGGTPREERRDLINKFKAGDIQALFNCMVLTAGFDAPETSAVMMIAPTKSDLVYVQRMGRGLRLAPGKKDCIVLDFNPMGGRNIIMAGDVLGKPRAVKKAEKKAESAGVMFAFNLDMYGETSEVDPGDLIVKVLNLLGHHYLSWYVGNQYAAAALGQEEIDTGKIDPEGESVVRKIAYSMVIELPDLERIKKAESLKSAGAWEPRFDAAFERITRFHLWLIKGSSACYKGDFATMEEAQSKADEMAEEKYTAILGGKDKKWRKESATDKQIGLLNKLGVKLPAHLSKGQAAQLITATMAWNAVKQAKVQKANNKSFIPDRNQS